MAPSTKNARNQILLPIGKTPRRGRGPSQSITWPVTKSFRSPPSPLQHPNTVKNTYRGSKTLELGPGTPAMGKGSHIREKSSSRPRSKYTHSGHNTQRSFDPPSPPPPKKGTQVRGGYGGQNQNINWGTISGTKMMILQGVRRQKPYAGVCYANDAKKGGIRRPRLRLIEQPLLKVIYMERIPMGPSKPLNARQIDTPPRNSMVCHAK